jgi:hypothetical protein
MARRPKAKPKRKSQRNTDKEQSARFIETARIVEADERGSKFESWFKKLVRSR